MCFDYSIFEHHIWHMLYLRFCSYIVFPRPKNCGVQSECFNTSNSNINFLICLNRSIKSQLLVVENFREVRIKLSEKWLDSNSKVPIKLAKCNSSFDLIHCIQQWFLGILPLQATIQHVGCFLFSRFVHLELKAFVLLHLFPFLIDILLQK